MAQNGLALNYRGKVLRNSLTDITECIIDERGKKVVSVIELWMAQMIIINLDSTLQVWWLVPDIVPKMMAGNSRVRVRSDAT